VSITGQVLKEGRLKNIITHIKKHGSPPSAEQEAAAAAALARMQLAAAAARPYELLPWDKQSRYEVFVHPEVKGGAFDAAFSCLSDALESSCFTHWLLSTSAWQQREQRSCCGRDGGVRW
jgi:hypothetical protein